MEEFDIIIVGAGPAGLKCAEVLSKSNMKILLLELNDTIGPKVCAGGLTGNDIKCLDLPENLLDYSYKEIKVHSRFFHTDVITDTPFVYTIDRKNLGQWQLDRLKDTKIDIRTNAKVTQIDKNHIIINGRTKIKYNHLIGADGSNSIVRRFLGLKSENKGIAIQYILNTESYNDFEVFFDSRLFHSWYAWIFPHRGYVSIGCGCNPKYLSANKLIENFNDWLK